MTMRAIAAAVGCSPMKTYRYFADRGAVLEALRADAFSDFADAQEAAASKAKSASARLESIREAYLRFALDRQDSYRLMFSLETVKPAGEAFQRQAGRSFEPLRATVAAAFDEGLLEGDPETVAHLIWVELHGMVSLHLSGKLDNGRSLEQIAKASPWRLKPRK